MESFFFSSSTEENISEQPNIKEKIMELIGKKIRINT